MKRIIIIVALMMSVGLAQAQEKIQWMDFEEAVEACKAKPKKLFIDVYTNWCGWCKRMDQTTFADTAVARYMNEHYYAVKFDAERTDTVTFYGQDFVYVPNPTAGKKGIHQLAAIMLQNQMSYPSYVIFNEDLKIIQVIPGYQEKDNFLPIIKFFGEDAFKTMTWDEFIGK